MKVHNFSAGPSILPQPVFQQASQGILDLNGSGLSILEISHRSKAFIEIHEKAKSLAKELLSVPDGHQILFLAGGASSQFFMSALNCLPQNGKAAYLDTGSWSSKAIKEAKRYGQVEVIASSKESGYRHIPKDYIVPNDAVYVHFTSNNTIAGTQYKSFPECSNPLVCDMSSDILSRPVDVSRFGIIYAGAQKNMGPAGVTLVIVREDMLGKVDRDIPSMLDYQVHIKGDSMFNTPPVFPIYVSLLTMQWLKENGGVLAVAKRNEEKASILYEEIDRNGMFIPVVEKSDRSLMNVTFLLKDASHEAAFLNLCKEAGCDGVKGHRSVGGFRASIYNAMPLEGVQALVEVMQKFEEQKG
ncbi:MAG: 3-phosphoserine/phosphohydroxythreonine transaminase [Saprospiraceae bacterium]|nr:3-phosphoserine/phosphohydroxythreonine transaminase [Saprospiraceae bacterium]